MRQRILKQLLKESRIILIKNEWGMRAIERAQKNKMFNESQIAESMSKMDLQRIQILNDIETLKEMIKENETN